MQWVAVCVLATAVCGGGGVTQTSDPQFWADYKIFDQVYGKIFDKDLYGDTLPPTVRFTGEAYQASDKKEIYTKDTQHDPYTITDKYNFLKKEKPATSTFNFLSYSGFKPISETIDPETYNYLKRLEEVEKERNLGLISTVGGFKPYVNDVDKPEETYAYKVIQNILDAHEANKGKHDDDEDNSQYLTYREKNNKKNKRKPPRMVNDGPKQRCLPGRCRKRSSISTSIRSRPYYRRVNYRIN